VSNAVGSKTVIVSFSRLEARDGRFTLSAETGDPPNPEYTVDVAMGAASLPGP
jgi:hypothetical protein